MQCKVAFREDPRVASESAQGLQRRDTNDELAGHSWLARSPGTIREIHRSDDTWY